MALQWSDFPSGQQGIYGTSTANMLNGTPWVAVRTGSSILPDPDSLNFPDGLVLKHGDDSDGPRDCTRLALPTPHEEVGVEFRFFPLELPSGSRCFVTMNSGGNSVKYNLVLQANGAIRVYYNAGALGPGTLIADSVAPVIFAGTWNHIGFKSNVVTGEYEVQKNGVPIAALTGTDPSPDGSGTIGLIGFPRRNPGSSGSDGVFYSKDIIVWNTLGTEINDFQGTVQVQDIYPDADNTLGGWTLSSGTEGFALVDETTPNDTDYVTSALPPTDPIDFGFTELSPDITSVRAVTTIMRAFNSESGDGNIQMSASPDAGVSSDTGTSHALTITPTYFWDHSTLSPATGFSWTPNEVNNISVSYNRTV